MAACKVRAPGDGSHVGLHRPLGEHGVCDACKVRAPGPKRARPEICIGLCEPGCIPNCDQLREEAMATCI